MPISVTCQSCGKKLMAGDSLAGRTVKCPGCKQPVAIVAAPAEEEEVPYAADATPRPRRRKKKRKREAHPAGPTPYWLRHLHWLLALALIPLAVSLLQADDRDFDARLDATLEQLSPETRDLAEEIVAEVELGDASPDELFELLPDRRLVGAFLPRNTWAHWGMAAIATGLFFGFCIVLALDRSASPVHLLLVGVFTATIGILLLTVLQLAADSRPENWRRGNVLAFLVVQLIAFCYAAALDPEVGFLASFVAFTLGVGFCEEVIKLLPVLARYWRPRGRFSWRTAFLWGLASGAGFGIAEGISYASNHYNGVTGPGIYVVRFISCVALHAVWTASAALMVHVRHGLMELDLAWYNLFLPIFLYIGVPMVLHGLYDTLLKKEMNAGALVVAVLSFGFLAGQIWWQRLREGEEAG